MAIKNYLDKPGLLCFWAGVKNWVSDRTPTKTSQIINDSGFITATDLPENATASGTTPKMAGIADAGTEDAFARGDHVHPSDAQKVDKIIGKGLSSNDYTTTEKNKLASIAENANNYVLPAATTLKVGGVALCANINDNDDTNTSKAVTPKAVVDYVSSVKAQVPSYGTCSTASATTAKSVTLSGFVRQKGSMVAVKFTYANSVAAPTLNINNTGSAAIYNCYTGASITSGSITAGMTALFIFNGAQWVLLNPAPVQTSKV